MKEKNINGNLNSCDITEVDFEKKFFHYTNINNLESIASHGLQPRIGNNSRGIERSAKTFFVIGDIGILAIMDVWLKWLILRPKNDYIYRFGAYLLNTKYFPKIIFAKIFKHWMSSTRKHKKACKMLKSILDDSVFLLLDLEENVDFSYKDLDEVKSGNFPNEELRYVYFENELESVKMDYWNMHTYSNKIIESSKVSLLKIGKDGSVIVN